MAKPLITEKTIRAHANAKSFARGKEYFSDGAVSEVIRRGNRVTAEVAGGDLYEVTIVLDDGDVAEARCTCPYDWDGYCKHVVAVLLKLAHGSDDVTERPPAAELIRDLDRDDLAFLLEKRLKSDRTFATWIEAELAALTARRAASSSGEGGRCSAAVIAGRATRRAIGRRMILTSYAIWLRRPFHFLRVATGSTRSGCWNPSPTLSSTIGSNIWPIPTRACTSCLAISVISSRRLP